MSLWLAEVRAGVRRVYSAAVRTRIWDDVRQLISTGSAVMVWSAATDSVSTSRRSARTDENQSISMARRWCSFFSCAG